LNDSRAGVVIMVPITTAHRDLPSHVEIDPGSSGLDEISYAKCEDIKSVSEQRLIGRLGAVSDEVIFQIARAALPAGALIGTPRIFALPICMLWW
jgi:mRNA interferase MazF